MKGCCAWLNSKTRHSTNLANFEDLDSYYDPITQKYICPCGSKLKLKKHFKFHRTHECGRKFLCPYCSHSSTTKTNLKQHMALKHGPVMNAVNFAFEAKNEVSSEGNSHENMWTTISYQD